MRLLVTGGAGFIGSNFTRMALKIRPDWEVTVLDKLTYAGRRENLEDLETDPRFKFIQGDICDEEAVSNAMEGCDTVVNFAAETHVDRSIDDSSSFVRTDIEGVRVLLEAFRKDLSMSMIGGFVGSFLGVGMFFSIASINISIFVDC